MAFGRCYCMKVLWFAIGFVCSLLLCGGAFDYFDSEVKHERTRGGTYHSAIMCGKRVSEPEMRALEEMGTQEFHSRMSSVIADELRRYIRELSWQVVEELVVEYRGTASSYHFTYSYKVALSSREERGLDGLRGALLQAVLKAHREHMEKARRGE